MKTSKYLVATTVAALGLLSSVANAMPDRVNKGRSGFAYSNVTQVQKEHRAEQKAAQNSDRRVTTIGLHIGKEGRSSTVTRFKGGRGHVGRTHLVKR